MTPDEPLWRELLHAWRDAGPKLWWGKDEGFDAELRARFEATHMAAAAGDLHDWEDEPEGALALVLLTDQISRNIFRDTAHAFATDPLALAVARRAVARGFDRKVDPALRPFFYMPFEHAEQELEAARAVELMQGLPSGTERDGYLRFARLHLDILRRFGRYPHRNRVLGRETTPEEARYLAEGGFKG